MAEFYTEKLIPIPADCHVTITDLTLLVTHGASSITRDFSHLVLYMDRFNDSIRLRLWNARRQERSKLITCSSHIRNMILGVTRGFEYVLKAAYVHFPISFEVAGDGGALVVKNFLGEKSQRTFGMRGDARVRMGEEKDTVVVYGCSVEDVSQSASSVQANCRPRNFDNRKFMDGVYVAKKRLIGD